MIVEIISASEVGEKEAMGWKRTGKEFCVIHGKPRTIEMQKEGDPLAWIEDDRKARAAEVANMNPTERRMHFQRVALKHRGYDV